jgi:DNA-binding MarR family transcriptional regulator
MEIDRTIHEPARLKIMMILSGVDAADFNFLLNTLGLTKGNLSAHIDKLEKSGYVVIKKSFNGKIPHTDYSLTNKGSNALSKYWNDLDNIRALEGTKK